MVRVLPQPAAGAPDAAQARTPSPAETAPVLPPSASRTAAPLAENAAGLPAYGESRFPYAILSAHFRSVVSARRGVANLLQREIPAYIVRVEIAPDDIWYRLLAGYYPTETAARRAIETYGLSGALAKKAPYANLVGLFASEAAYDRQRRALEAKGFFPYGIPSESGTYLFVGAFYTREGARTQQRRLLRQGIASRIVTR
jgi:hypothetical protein